MGALPPQYPPITAINEVTPQEQSDPQRFKNMTGFGRSRDSSEGESPEHSPSRIPECNNEKPVKRRASRAGTRSVSTLTPAQLSRKRANDREAQRAIRQRTKEHIEKLELRIAELESGCNENGPGAKFDEILLRNAVLERQIIQLARQLQLTCNPFGYGGEKHYDQPEISPVSQWSSNSFGSGNPDGVASCESIASNGYINPGMTAASYSPTSMQIALPPGANPPYIDTSVGNGMGSMVGTSNESSDWLPTTMDQRNGVPNCASIPRSIPNFPGTSPLSPQSPIYRQPAIYSWEIPTKIVQPISTVDHILLSIVQFQRAMLIDGAPRSQVLGSIQPNMKALIYDDAETHASLHPVTKGIADICRNTMDFKLPERVACFYTMYHYLQWQILPSPETFNNIPEWYQPRPSQSLTPHSIWVDMVVFQKLREKIIDNREIYETEEMQQTIAVSLNLNWPYRDLDVLDVVDEGGPEGGEVRVSEQFKRHFMNLDNWSLDAPFSRRYPELADVCRFTDGGGREAGSGTGSPLGR